MKTKITPSDKVVFVLNKVDETDFVVGPGNVKLELALKNTDYWYPNIFVAITQIGKHREVVNLEVGGVSP